MKENLSLSLKEHSFLLITTSGGNGNLQAAIAKEQQLKEDYPKAKIAKIDLLLQGLSFLGRIIPHFWNTYQKRGSTKRLEWMASKLQWFDVVFWPYVFFWTLYHLKKQSPDRVFDTQPLATAGIIRAIRVYNFWQKKELVLEKILLEFPTKQASSILFPIRRLSKKNQKYLKLITVEPLLEEEKTEGEFWEKYCKLSKEEVNYQNFVIRKPFLEYQRRKRREVPFSFSFSFPSEREKEEVQRIVEKRKKIGFFSQRSFRFEIAPSDILITVLLGSQSAYLAKIKYLKIIMEVASKFPEKNLYVASFCPHSPSEKKTLFSMVCKEVSKKKDFPSNLTIIPLSFQPDEVIAPLFFRSDITLTRSGGQTSMELLAVARGISFIHSEISYKTEELESLLKGIPCWESGNALYLIRKKEAEVVTPYIFSSHLEKALEKRMAPSSLSVHKIAN